TQFGITLSSLLLGSIGEPAMAAFIQLHVPDGFGPKWVHTVAIVAAFAVISFLQIVLGELVPRVLAIRNADVTILSVAPLLFLWRNFFKPFLAIFERSAKFILRIIGVRTGNQTKN